MVTIPFEPQQTIDGSRTCGAAALTMVYRSLGLECRQDAVWQRVAEQIGSGGKATRTHRLALDACKLGLSAVILQAEQPAPLLTQLLEADARVILNHRLDDESALGHYSVLLSFDGNRIVIHDPHRGPERALPWPEFTELWQPCRGRCEIIGRVLIALGVRSQGNRACTVCGSAVPLQVSCGRCDQAIALGPQGAVGCVVPGCAGQSWTRLFCPHCDWAVSHI